MTIDQDNTGGSSMDSLLNSVSANLRDGDLLSSDNDNDNDDDEPDGALKGGNEPPSPSPAPAAPTPSAPAPAPAEDEIFATYPKTWSPALKELWKTADPALRAQIETREQQMFTGLEQYRTLAGVGKEVNDMFQPYTQLLEQSGLTQSQVVKNLLDAQILLATGTPEARKEFIRNLAADYNIQLDGQGNETASEVAELRRQLRELQSVHTRHESERAAERQAKIESEVMAFFTSDENPMAKDCHAEIAQLLQGDKTLTLKAAYEKALWLNPGTRAKMLAKQQAEAAKKLEEDALAAKRAAGANIKSQHRPPAPKVGHNLEDLRSSVAATLEEITNRK